MIILCLYMISKLKIIVPIKIYSFLKQLWKDKMIPLAKFPLLPEVFNKGVSKQTKYHKIPEINPELIITGAYVSSERILCFKIGWAYILKGFCCVWKTVDAQMYQTARYG